MEKITLLNNTSGLTIYAFPINQSLADWLTYRVLIAEGTSPDTGRYTADLDPANGTQWVAFVGASQPSGWAEALEGIGWDISTTEEGMKAGVRAGIGGRWKNLGTAANQDDISVEDIP